ncbi:hypothetical protein X798_02170 [Onchocerca flexuosa]|uniref:N-acetyltransferase domain-containing protein n=1 Tax=Onchocerca flexuosa TaxID=387005 RepID=A0A238BZQ8_9BILA|nr:hypothetical protein X798_02170 [Onchocerca flexuosa]
MEETEFNGLSMQRVTKTDFDGIKKFLLTDFLYNEPLNRSVNLSAEDSDELFNAAPVNPLHLIELVDVGIASSLSYILQTPDGKIVALRLASILDRPAEEHPSEIWILINPRLKRLLLWSVISVHKDYTRSGLAKKLLCYKLHEAKQMGCQGCISEASSFKSQLLFKKLGYETIHELKHGDWLDDRGQQIFQCDDSTNSIHLVFKLL